MIKLEKDESSLLAVVYGRGCLAHVVAQSLKKQHLRVILIQEPTEALSVLEKPSYIFFFANSQSFDEALQSATKNGTKLVLILNNIDESMEKILLSKQQKSGWPVAVIEIKGEIEKTDNDALEAASSKIIRSAFSHQDSTRQVILGKKVTKEATKDATYRAISTQDVFNNLKKFEKKPKLSPMSLISPLVIVFILILIFSPIVLIGWPSFQGFIKLNQAGHNLAKGQFVQAENQAKSAKDDILMAKNSLRLVNVLTFGVVIPLEKYFSLLVISEVASDVITRSARLGTPINELIQGVFSGETANIPSVSKKLIEEIKPINEDLGIIEAQAKDITGGIGDKILNLAGAPPDNKVSDYLNKLPLIRSYLTRLENLLPVWEEIIPNQGRKTYLVVFQNSAELRPTGGFIGSYGLVIFDSGKLIDWQIYDIYTADGQLRGQITPPDEILHFLGQPSWYMRDANWSADFPLTAKRLLWFLEKEIGQKADGVIGVNLGATQKLLKATGPLFLADLNMTVSDEDFFEKAEYSSEINFFAGSTQKKDFLGATAKAIFSEISLNSQKDWLSIAQALLSSLEEKDIILYFDSPSVQSVISETGWSGTIELTDCHLKGTDCLMLVEANVGANKANYYVRRSLRIDSIISKGGDIDTTVKVRYQNNSPSEAWPGGVYKNYLRFLVPKGAKLTNFNIGDSRRPLVSPILTASEMAKTTENEFFVFQSQENSYTSYGTLVTIPVQSEVIISLTYRSPNKVSLASTKPVYNLIVLKQPGTGADLVDFSLEYPSFLKPDLHLVNPQKLIYNSDLSIDRKFNVKFINTFK